MGTLHDIMWIERGPVETDLLHSFKTKYHRPIMGSSCRSQEMQSRWGGKYSGSYYTRYFGLFGFPHIKYNPRWYYKICSSILFYLKQKPVSVRECNRVPCPAQWKAIGWSACSISCGKEGVQKREYICEPSSREEKFFDCGMKPSSVRPCNPEPPKCKENNNVILTSVSSSQCEDASPICGDDVMMRYCAIPSYSALCCNSCKTYVENK